MVSAAITFYIAYTYLTKDSENIDNTVYVYSSIPSIIVGILVVILYSKYCPNLFQKQDTELLQEDFYT